MNSHKPSKGKPRPFRAKAELDGVIHLRTCEEMHGDWRQACDRWDFDSAEYEDHRRRWCDRFIDILLNGKRDTRKFHMTKDGATVNVTIRRSQYGGLTGSYRYTNAPKRVSWVRQAVIRREFPFGAIEAQ